MIIKKHSLSARTNQIKKVLKLLIENENAFNGAYFVKGDFIINEKK